MAKVTGFTAARMLAIEKASVVSAAIEGDDELIFYTRGGTRIRAGVIKGGTAEWIRDTQPIIEAHENILSSTNDRLEEIHDILDAAESNINAIPDIRTNVSNALNSAQDALASASGALQAAGSAQATADAAQAAASGALHVANLADEAAQNRIFFGEQPPPFEDWVEGQIWAQTALYEHWETGDESAVTVGLYRVQDWQNPDSAWSTYTLMSGMIIVPGVDEDGNPRPTVIDQSGMVIGHVTADSITGDVVAARTIRGEHLVIASVSPDVLDEATQETLEGADAVRRRVVIDETGIIISESAVGEGGVGSLSGLDLKARRLSFFLEGEPRGYFDSEKNMLATRHLLVEESAQFGEHQVLALGGDAGQTIFQWTGFRED